jgi:hypothetical protein
MGASVALLSLQDSNAPYKGIWQICQAEPGNFEAIHSTYVREQSPGCVIEQRRFGARAAATDFARHLIAHGWDVRDLYSEGEHFWYGLPDAHGL